VKADADRDHQRTTDSPRITKTDPRLTKTSFSHVISPMNGSETRFRAAGCLGPI